MFKRCVAVLLMAAMLMGVVPLTVHAAPVYYNEAIHTDFGKWLDDLDDDALLLMLFGYAHFDNDAVLYFAFLYFFPHRHYFPISLKGTQPDPWFHPLGGGGLSCPQQSGNLFMFVMHNPVRFRDPLGLFAWNEADDDWIVVTRGTTEGAGGTFSQNFRINASNNLLYISTNISIWGVDFSFSHSPIFEYFANDLIRGHYGGISVRADLFYQTVLAAAGGEIAFLGGHTANIPGASAYHMHIAIFAVQIRDADNIAYNRLRRAGSENIRWGVIRYGYISGGSSSLIGLGGRVIGGVNTSSYTTRANRQFFHHLGSGVGTGANLFGGLDHFMANHNRAFWWSGRWTNSTSFTIGLVNAMGHSHGLSATQIANSWGIDNAFSARHFGR